MAGPNQQAAKDTRTGSADASNASGSGYENDPFGMAGWMKDMPVHPLMRHPVAAMATAGAISIGMTSHMAGLMFGAMQGLAETALKAGLTGENPMSGAATEDLAREPTAKTAGVPAGSPAKARQKRSKTVVRMVEAPADDLKRISGIGPKLQQVLNGLGVWRYADIAAWSEAETQRFDERLGLSGRIQRDGWVEQAKALAKG